MFFVFKQKTAYEIEYGFVGSEMCIRDRIGSVNLINLSVLNKVKCFVFTSSIAVYGANQLPICLLYTSDAADERSSVDLGGRRIIKKKNNLRM